MIAVKFSGVENTQGANHSQLMKPTFTQGCRVRKIRSEAFGSNGDPAAIR
ncbi:MAG: hypothetical protein RL240_2946 [Planctomycetota bacterium]|jgi:hypothetical protein